MTWSEPKLLWLLALAPFFVGLLFWNGVRIGRRVTRLLGRGEGADLKPYKYPWIKFGLLTIAFSLLCIAAAGPRWDWHWIESKQRGLDIMVAIDVSRSMDVKDIDPSRIEHARRMVRDLLDIAEGDRIGLIAFAGVSFVQCPLTTDREAVRMFLDVINTNLIPTQGTDLAGAMSVAIKSLAASGEGTGKILMILSDGEDHKSDSQTAIAASINALKTAGIRVFSVGLGTPDGGPIPSDSGSFKSDRSGNMVISRLEVQVLKVISAGTDGIYVTGGTPGAQIEELYRSGMHRLGTELETRSQRERVWFERYQWFAGASLLLLIIEGLLLWDCFYSGSC
ncbi:MAG: VWA domain-containing protein [Proteobacteria bacterium]|nr:VWA domain-containing protein [Pseudomonadota bacterium]